MQKREETERGEGVKAQNIGLNCSIASSEVMCGIKLHNSESYKAAMFIAAPGAREITPPNLHTESRSTHLFVTKLI